MPQLKLLYAEPFRLVLIPNVCTYCSKVNTKVECAEFQLGILTCDDHKPLAVRDVRAYLHRRGQVMYKDAIQDPLFTTTGLLEMDIKVRRSSGAIENNWKLAKPSFGNRCLVSLDDSGNWYMIASLRDDEIIRGVHVSDLKMVLPATQHMLVDRFIERLSAGFYKAEQEAYLTAVAESSDNPGPACSESNIYTIHHPSIGYGRVVIPPIKGDPELFG